MQLKQIRKDIDLCVEAHGTFGFTLPALATIPSVRKGTAVAASSLIRADASAEADETPPVQHTMQSIIGMLVLCKRAATGRLAPHLLLLAWQAVREMVIYRGHRLPSSFLGRVENIGPFPHGSGGLRDNGNREREREGHASGACVSYAAAAGAGPAAIGLL